MSDWQRNPGAIDDPGLKGGTDPELDRLPPGDSADDVAPQEPQVNELDMPGPDDPVAWSFIEPGTPITGREGVRIGKVDAMLGTEMEGIFHGIALDPAESGPVRVIPADLVTSLTPSEVRVQVAADEVDGPGGVQRGGLSPTIPSMASSMADAPLVDRLWPDPRSALPLDEAFSDLALPEPPADRPLVGVNMISSVDGRAQLDGLADGLGSREDRRLMRLYRVGYDAVASGAGTLRADDFYSWLPDDLAQRRVELGKPPQPLAIVIGGSSAIPTDRRFFAHPEQPRAIAVGSDSPHAGSAELARRRGLDGADGAPRAEMAARPAGGARGANAPDRGRADRQLVVPGRRRAGRAVLDGRAAPGRRRWTPDRGLAARAPPAARRQPGQRPSVRRRALPALPLRRS